MDQPDRRPPEPARLEAHAADSAVVNQAGRDLHVHHGPGVRRTTTGRAGECPYPGLAAFESSEARWFFGRDTETAELLERLDRRASSGGIQFVVAPSGAGKSSLLRAGLLASLADDALPGSAGWTVRLRTPGSDPLAALDDPGDLLVLDQFEELFAADPAVARRAVEQLAELAGSGMRVVLGLRADFYTNCTDHPVLRAALRDRPVLLGPMGDDELRAAIRFPAQDVGLEIEDGLIELVLADLDGDGTRQAGRLPLLAHALRACWRQRHGHVLTVDGYRATGGIERAIATTAEDTYAALDPPGQAAARALFTRLVRIGTDTPDTRRRLVPGPLSAELGASGASVLEAFTRQRLLTRARDSVEITHEALLRAWPRLAEWISRDRSGALLRQQLDEDAEQWQRSGRDAALLYRGSRLEAARDWAEVHRDVLGSTGAAFLASAHDAHQRGVRTRRAAVAALTALAVVASAAAGVSLLLGARYRAERDAALATQLSSQADVVRAGDPSLAAQLDLAAYRRHPTPRTRLALALDAGRPLATPLPGDVAEFAYRGDGRAAAAVALRGGQGRLTLWDIPFDGPARPAGPPVDIGPVPPLSLSVSFTPDGHTVLVELGGQGAQRWDVSDLAHPKRHPGLLVPGYGGARDTFYSADGRRMLTYAWGSGSLVQLWDIGDPAAPRQLASLSPAPGADLYPSCLDISGRTALINTSVTTVRWDFSDPAHPTPTPPLAGDSGSIVCRPGADVLAKANPLEETFQLWDVRDSAHPAAIGGNPHAGVPIAWSPDGRLLATASPTGQLQLWNVTDPNNPVTFGGPFSVGRLQPSAVFGPDGRTVTTLVSDGEARLWRLPPLSPIGGIRADGRSLGDSVSASGDVVAASGSSSQLWRITNRAAPTPLAAVAGNALVFAPDGSWLATRSKDGLQLTDVRDPAHPRALGSPFPDTGGYGVPPAVAVSADGQLLMVSSYGTGEGVTDTLWDVSDPAHRELLGTFPADLGKVQFAGFLPGGPRNRVVVTAPSYGLRLWDASDRHHVTTVQPPVLPHESISTAVSAGRLLAVSADSGVHLFDVTDPTRPTPVGPTLPQPGARGSSTGWSAGLGSLAVAPDGRILAVSTESGIQFWDVSDPSHPNSVGSPVPGQRVAFGAGSMTISDLVVPQVWDLDPDRAAAHICAATPGVLTEANWPTHAGPDIDYEPTCP